MGLHCLEQALNRYRRFKCVAPRQFELGNVLIIAIKNGGSSRWQQLDQFILGTRKDEGPSNRRDYS